MTFLNSLDPEARLSPDAAAQLVLMRRKARVRFEDFVLYWIIATRAPIKWGWHISYLCDIMQAVADRVEEYRFLCINIPPRFLKSTLLSQLWQAWMIGRDDTAKSSLFTISSSAILACRDSRATLDILRSDWYKALFPHVRIGTKETEAEWNTVGGAYRIAAGRAGTVTGRGAHHLCIHGDARVSTSEGLIKMRDMRAGMLVKTPAGLRRVLQAWQTAISPVMAIHTATSTLQLTPTHICSTPDGWLPAGSLRVGGFVHAASPDCQALRPLREGVARNQTVGAVLLEEVQRGESVEGAHFNDEMRNMREGVSAAERRDLPSVLFSEVPINVEGGGVPGGGKSSVHSREVCGAIPVEIPKGSGAGTNCNSRRVSEVWCDEKAVRTPRERNQDGRLSGESQGVVCPVSSEITRIDPIGTVSVPVYDMTIEDAHCFYAEGILVHNCVDDLVSAEEGDSETVREEANTFLSRSLRSRLDDQMTGTITNIQQRLHERDATGVLTSLAKIPGGDVYKVITLPNEAECKTVVSIGPRVYAIREQGDLLHPDYLGRRETNAIKASQRRNYDGQYQQRPSKMEGGHLDPRRILRLPGSGIEIKIRLGLTPIFYLDFAGTEKKSQKDDPDFNVIHVLARDELRRLIHLDIWRKQTADYGEMARVLISMHKFWRPLMVKGEKGALLNLFQPALKREMIAKGHFLTLEPLKAREADKIARSMDYQAELNAGVVCAPEQAPWFLDYEAECRTFPRGAHDDQIEGAADAAMDNMPTGNSPVVSPTDPAVLLSDEIKRRIEREKERLANPEVANGHYW